MMFVLYIALVSGLVSGNPHLKSALGDDLDDRSNVTDEATPTFESIEATSTAYHPRSETIVTSKTVDESPLPSAIIPTATVTIQPSASIVVTVPFNSSEASSSKAVTIENLQSTTNSTTTTQATKTTDEDVEQDFLTSLKEAVRKVVNFSVGVMLTPFLIGAHRATTQTAPPSTTPANSVESNQIDTD